VPNPTDDLREQEREQRTRAAELDTASRHNTPEAWTAILPHAASLRGYCATLAGQPGHDANDLHQASLLRGSRYWQPNVQATLPWLRSIARNLARGHPDRSAVRDASLTPWGDPDARADEPAAPATNDTLEAEDAQLRILRLVTLLPPHDQAVIAALIDGYSPDRISQEFDIERRNVRFHVLRARRRLRALLDSDADPTNPQRSHAPA